MEIDRFKSGSDKWEFVKVSKKEALSIIASLTKQLLEDNPNVGRLESHVDGGYFTIAVVEEEPKKESKLPQAYTSGPDHLCGPMCPCGT